MKQKDEPLDDFESALADIAEVRNWSSVWGPSHGGGPDGLSEIAERVRAATGWSTAPPDGGADMRQVARSFTTGRGVVVTVGPGSASFATGSGGWSAYRLSAEDYPQALAILRQRQWPRYLDLVSRYLGPPAYVASCVDADFPSDRWRDEYDPHDVGYLGVWERPGLEFHLYASHAGLRFNPAHPAMSIQYLVRQPAPGR